MFLVKQANQNDYHYCEFFLDNINELPQVLLSEKGKKACPGSIAFIIDTGDVYILNSQREWIPQ